MTDISSALLIKLGQSASVIIAASVNWLSSEFEFIRGVA
jgi:hypothetical protein